MEVGLWLIGALRAVVEMLGLCLLAQAALRVIAGTRHRENPIYRLFELITRPPRTIVHFATGRRLGQGSVSAITFVLLVLLWLGLAILRKSI